MNPAGERVAAIDVGSNTILLTVAEYDPASGLVLLEEGEDQPRLAAGLSVTKRLGEDAMKRSVVALTGMRDTCHRLGVQRVTAVATAAVREATNGADFVGRVQALDIPLRVIPPETEAALSYRSAAYRFPGEERTLVADMGGGSLELIGAVSNTISLSRSLPLGAVRLTELRVPGAELREHIRRLLAKAVPPEWNGSRIIGSGGTFATLASMTLAQRDSRTKRIHGTVVHRGEVRRWQESLAQMSPEKRRETPGLQPERADIIGAGLAVIAELLDAVGVDNVTVSGFGLRDGLLLEMLGLG